MSSDVSVTYLPGRSANLNSEVKLLVNAVSNLSVYTHEPERASN